MTYKRQRSTGPFNEREYEAEERREFLARCRELGVKPLEVGARVIVASGSQQRPVCVQCGLGEITWRGLLTEGARVWWPEYRVRFYTGPIVGWRFEYSQTKHPDAWYVGGSYRVPYPERARGTYHIPHERVSLTDIEYDWRCDMDRDWSRSHTCEVPEVEWPTSRPWPELGRF